MKLLLVLLATLVCANSEIISEKRNYKFLFEVVCKLINQIHFNIFSASWLQTCELKKPQFTKCSTQSIRGLFNNVFSGKYKIDGLESLDPMVLDKIKVLQGDGPVSVNASLSKVKIYGFSKVELVQNQVSAKDYSWITLIKLPKIRLEANYRMQGQILIIPLNVSFKREKSIVNSE